MRNVGLTAMKMTSSSHVLMPPWCLKTYNRKYWIFLPALMVATSWDWNLYQADIMMMINLMSNKAVHRKRFASVAIFRIVGTTSIFNVAPVTHTTTNNCKLSFVCVHWPVPSIINVKLLHFNIHPHKSPQYGQVF